ncbi:arsenic resistance protein [Halorubrum salipaludis]|jgi:ACR3 family arsenite transporter|uniref:Arsenic resistance protein n=1 Tax=Halorubrum salipaludis TaxID=2032630 RepID=A0A2A2F855_9EURY|nr:bile acid:sodium symporter [Halorubrum salipaludis]PAU80802.1 arsenic resistance protein [Halorubrum salipaludis]
MDAKEWLRRHQVLVYAVAVALAVVIGAGRPMWATPIEGLINPVLAVLLYVTFLEIPFVRLRRAFTNGRFIGVALGLNFLVVPVVVWGLTRVLPSDRVVLVGVLMVLLTPCIDYVITFTDLADGDAEQLTATTPALMLVQLLLLPLYLWLFVGPEIAAVIEAGPFIEAFVLIIALPLGLAWLTEAGAERSGRVAGWQETLGWFPVPMMGVTLFVVIASQLPRVQDAFDQIVVVVPVYVAFLFVMPLLGRLVSGLFGMDVGERRALVFTSVTRNSLVVLPLGLALPAGYELVPAIIVTQTLVELSGMVVLTRVVPAVLVPAPPADDSQPTVPSGE